jgi:hypothetical protein
MAGDDDASLGNELIQTTECDKGTSMAQLKTPCSEYCGLIACQLSIKLSILSLGYCQEAL